MLRSFSQLARWLSLHMGDPGAQGNLETSAARQPITWDEPHGSELATAQDIEFVVPAHAAAAFVGYWTARVGGIFLGGRPLSHPMTFETMGIYRIPAGLLVEALSDG